MGMPKISVLLPVYNVEKQIEKCFRSLLMNTIAHDCEFILVDDCSPDNSITVAKNVINKYSELAGQVKIIAHSFNKGLAAARNTGLLEASGKYFICVDSDDFVEPDYLETLYTKAEQANADIVGCDTYQELGKKTLVKHQPLQSTGRLCVQDMFTNKLCGWVWIKLFRRDFIIENNIQWIDGINLCEDLLFSTKAFYVAQRIAYVSRPLYCFHI